jgi:hypothetical protein
MAATAGLSLALDPMGKMFQNASFLKPLGQFKPNCPGMIIGRSSKNMGKCSNAFFSETTNMIKAKLYMNVPFGFPIGIKNLTFVVEDLSMIIPGQFGFNCPSGLRKQAF